MIAAFPDASQISCYRSLEQDAQNAGLFKGNSARTRFLFSFVVASLGEWNIGKPSPASILSPDWEGKRSHFGVPPLGSLARFPLSALRVPSLPVPELPQICAPYMRAMQGPGVAAWQGLCYASFWTPKNLGLGIVINHSRNLDKKHKGCYCGNHGFGICKGHVHTQHVYGLRFDSTSLPPTNMESIRWSLTDKSIHPKSSSRSDQAPARSMEALPCSLVHAEFSTPHGPSRLVSGKR